MHEKDEASDIAYLPAYGSPGSTGGKVLLHEWDGVAGQTGAAGIGLMRRERMSDELDGVFHPAEGTGLAGGDCPRFRDKDWGPADLETRFSVGSEIGCRRGCRHPRGSLSGCSCCRMRRTDLIADRYFSFHASIPSHSCPAPVQSGVLTIPGQSPPVAASRRTAGKAGFCPSYPEKTIRS